MAFDINLNGVSISLLSSESRRLLSSLLNPKKILPCDGPNKLPRDWRGIASLVNITSEMASCIDDYPDKMTQVLDTWLQTDSGNATISQLMKFLQQIDRYDVYDDILDLARRGALVNHTPHSNSGASRQVAVIDEQQDSLITFDDVKYGTPQQYHAYILYALEDKAFVDELISRMRSKGLRICTGDDLLPGHATQYGPVSKLISKRCHRIILVCSPEFLKSPANAFYTDYAQAVGIENKKLNIIPIIYRKCDLPTNLTYYHALYYKEEQSALFDFWHKLTQSLETAAANNSNSQSVLNVLEISGTGFLNMERLALPGIPSKSRSFNDIDTLQEDSISVGNMSQVSDGRKKVSLKKMFNPFKWKKHKKPIMLEN